MPELSKKETATDYLSRYLRHSQQNPYRRRLPTLRELKRDYIRFCLMLTGENYQEAARLLKIDPQLLKKYILTKTSSS